MKAIAASEFLSVVQPALEAGDAARIVQAVSKRWVPLQVCGLLDHSDLDARRLATLTLGFVGDHHVLGHLARSLSDPDDQVHNYAEDAIWSIWFRLGKPQALPAFTAGLDALGDESYDDAVEHFEDALIHDPQFAEAHHQSAIAHYSAGRWIESKVSAKQALALRPGHFGAMSIVGHCHAHQHEYSEAINYYRRTLAIHPYLDAVDTALRRLEQHLAFDAAAEKESVAPWDFSEARTHPRTFHS